MQNQGWTDWLPDPEMRSPGLTSPKVSRGADRKGASQGASNEAVGTRSPKRAQGACVSLDVFVEGELVGHISETADCSLAWSATLILIGTFADRHVAVDAIVAHRGRLA
jgi:hypothetical protein